MGSWWGTLSNTTSCAGQQPQQPVEDDVGQQEQAVFGQQEEWEGDKQQNYDQDPAVAEDEQGWEGQAQSTTDAVVGGRQAGQEEVLQESSGAEEVSALGVSTSA